MYEFPGKRFAASGYCSKVLKQFGAHRFAVSTRSCIVALKLKSKMNRNGKYIILAETLQHKTRMGIAESLSSSIDLFDLVPLVPNET